MPVRSLYLVFGCTQLDGISQASQDAVFYKVGQISFISDSFRGDVRKGGSFGWYIPMGEREGYRAWSKLLAGLMGKFSILEIIIFFSYQGISGWYVPYKTNTYNNIE